MEYLVVDAYNVINAWNDVFDMRKEKLEDCRLKLLDILSDYQGYKKANIIVVFDAHMVSGSQEKEEIYDNITVVYTKENETADNYIERFVYKNANKNVMPMPSSKVSGDNAAGFQGAFSEKVLKENKLFQKNVIRVVTSDYLEQTLVLSMGGVRMVPRELKEDITKTKKASLEEFNSPKIKSNELMSHLTPELVEVLEKMRRSKF